MKTRRVIWITFGSILFIALVLYLNSLVPHTYDWSETYDPNDNQPFTKEVCIDLLKEYFPNHDFSILQKNPIPILYEAEKNTNYIFLHNNFYSNDSLANALLKFIERGNTAFISANNFFGTFQAKLFPEIKKGEETFSWLDFNTDSTSTAVADKNWYAIEIWNMPNVEMRIPQFGKSSTYQYQEKDKLLNYSWKYFSNSLFENSSYNSIYPIGYFNDTKTNYIQISIGSGNLLIYSNPIVFTNFFMIQENHLDYISAIFSFLSEGDILLDQYSFQSHGSNEETMSESEGPLTYILSQKSLRWAWYLLVLSAILFVIFQSKRKQQSIPISEPNLNKSLEFVQTIGRMYAQRNDAKNLMQQQMKILLHFIKDKYKIPTTQIDESFFERLSLKSQVDKTDIKNIFEYYNQHIKRLKLNNEELISFKSFLDQFYHTCK